MRYTIQNENLTVTIDSFGAELCSVKQGEKEWIWQNPSGNWSGHSPLLFPVCGAVRCMVDGVEYEMARHGFARKSEFALTGQGEDFLRFTLKSNEDTKKIYPFDFSYHVTYSIEKGKLTVKHVVENDGDRPLYFACGGHESFNLQTNVEDYALEFEKEEHLIHQYHSDYGLIEQYKDFGTGKFLPLPAELLYDNLTAIFPNIRSRKVWLCEKNGKRLAEVTFAEELTNLLLWRSENDPFICIEPWSNLPDLDGAPDVEFSSKKGVMKVEVGQSKTLVRSVEYL